MPDLETTLSGGNVTPVVRIGDTVRRQTGPWSEAVHALLRHLEAAGFAGAPRFLGLDDRGREILTFLPGEVGHDPRPEWMWSDDVLDAVARLLRRYHDATVGFVPPAGAYWRMVYPDPTRHEVVCHNDVAPYNLVFRERQPVALFDFDFAGPGPRVWDLAYAAYRFVPLSNEPDVRALGLADPARQDRRLRRFVDAYGLERPTELPAAVEERLEALCAFLEARAAAGDPVFGRHVAEGHLALYQRDLAYVRERQLAFRDALT
jgi:hypothetical protein